MMDSNIIRVAVALLLAVLLWTQARKSGDRPRRRRAFELAAGALLALAAFNGTLAAGAEIGLLQLVVAAVGTALLIAAIVAFIASYRGGEMSAQRDQVAAAAQEYRERRTKERQ
jgi:drug/metabolite transporter (DMT)-like permease